MPYSPALPDSPTLPDFNPHPVHIHKAKYTTALETEHSRDLYLQGAMAVGQIARLLEELCAGQYDSDNGAEDDAAGELATHPSDFDGVHQFLSHEKQDQINAWAYAVHPADNDINHYLSQWCDADTIDMEDADTTYLRGACVVGDIANLLKDLVVDLRDDNPEDHKTNSSYSSEKVALAQLSDASRKHTDVNFEARMSRLSARLAQLEVDIKEFSQDRNDALKQMELDDAAQDEEQSDCCQGKLRHVVRMESLPGAGVQDIRDSVECEESAPITRVWTTTDTATSGFSLITPAESDTEPLGFTSAKNYLWSEEASSHLFIDTP